MYPKIRKMKQVKIPNVFNNVPNVPNVPTIREGKKGMIYMYNVRGEYRSAAGYIGDNQKKDSRQ